MIVNQLTTTNNESLSLPTTFIGIDTATIPKVLKSSPFHNRIVKVSRGINAMVSQNVTTNTYRNMVQKALVQQGDNPENFVLQPRQWGKRVPETPFVEHKGQYYLELLVMGGVKPDVTYYCDGMPIDKADITGLRDSPSKPHQGGLEKTVIVRTVKLDNILEIRANGKVYGPKRLPVHMHKLKTAPALLS